MSAALDLAAEIFSGESPLRCPVCGVPMDRPADQWAPCSVCADALWPTRPTS